MTPSLHWNPTATASMPASWAPFWAHSLPRATSTATRPAPRSTHAHTAVRMDVRLIRPLRESGHGRMVLTGRMADVCAALDLMVAAQESPLEAC